MHAGTDIPGLLGASLAGTAASLLFAALFASLLTKKPAAPDTLLTTSTAAAKGSSQQTALLAVAAFAAVGPLVLTKFDPTAFGQLMTVPVGLAWSLFGFLAGRAVGFNPMLLGAAAANAGVFWHGKLMGWGYAAAMDAFFGQVGWAALRRAVALCSGCLTLWCACTSTPAAPDSAAAVFHSTRAASAALIHALNDAA